jgi:hypothetical protein
MDEEAVQRSQEARLSLQHILLLFETPPEAASQREDDTTLVFDPSS